jgi:hypothetical protein
MLIHGEAESGRNAIRLIFNGQKPIEPERKSIHGKEVMVIPVADLVKMKLTSNRDKDRVHIRSLDAAALVSHKVEMQLTPELQTRLKHIRETE